MSRRSRPPRARKSRNPEGPRQDVVVVSPPVEDPGDDLVREAAASPLGAEPNDELAAVDAGWD
jgi:hypothetical protein